MIAVLFHSDIEKYYFSMTSEPVELPSKFYEIVAQLKCGRLPWSNETQKRTFLRSSTYAEWFTAVVTMPKHSEYDLYVRIYFESNPVLVHPDVVKHLDQLPDYHHVVNEYCQQKLPTHVDFSYFRHLRKYEKVAPLSFAKAGLYNLVVSGLKTLDPSDLVAIEARRHFPEC